MYHALAAFGFGERERESSAKVTGFGVDAIKGEYPCGQKINLLERVL